jgi:hypothetical protein
VVKKNKEKLTKLVKCPITDCKVTKPLQLRSCRAHFLNIHKNLNYDNFKNQIEEESFQEDSQKARKQFPMQEKNGPK